MTIIVKSNSAKMTLTLRETKDTYNISLSSKPYDDLDQLVDDLTEVLEALELELFTHDL